jgi:thiamine pyrophosphate-dependent acetolactate synthase large subunit-like protein
MAGVTVPEAIGATLARLGVRQFFGLVGSGNFAVTNALVAAGASFVPSRHEGGAITAADAYARVCGVVGVCSVHQGPGLTNAITGLTEAAKSRTPLLLLAADTAAAAIHSNFRIDQAGLVEAVGACVVCIDQPEVAVAATVRAYQLAESARRPVVLLLPLDVQMGCCEPPAELPAPAAVAVPAPAPEAIAAAVDALAGAQRPLIVAGRGAVRAAAGPAIAALAERSGALLATSAVANGLFAGNPWSLGISGGFASPLAATLIRTADVVLGVGVAFNMWTTRHGQLFGPDTTIIQIDDEAEAIGRHQRADLAVVGDAAASVGAILDELRRRDSPPAPCRTPELAARIEAGGWGQQPYADASTAEQIDPRTLSRSLDALLPAARTVVTDSGHFMGYPAMYLRVPDARGFVFTQAFQAVGLACAIGGALARPDRLTVAALGDGGALMGLAELETVARLGLHMLIVVYNDAAYGAEVHHFGPGGADLEQVRFPDTDFAALGRAVGLAGVTVRRATDLEAVGAWLAQGNGGLVLDAKVVPTVVAEWLEEAFRGH